MRSLAYIGCVALLLSGCDESRPATTPVTIAHAGNPSLRAEVVADRSVAAVAVPAPAVAGGLAPVVFADLAWRRVRLRLTLENTGDRSVTYRRSEPAWTRSWWADSRLVRTAEVTPPADRTVSVSLAPGQRDETAVDVIVGFAPDRSVLCRFVFLAEPAGSDPGRDAIWAPPLVLTLTDPLTPTAPAAAPVVPVPPSDSRR